jgi:hypothetical protein
MDLTENAFAARLKLKSPDYRKQWDIVIAASAARARAHRSMASVSGSRRRRIRGRHPGFTPALHVNHAETVLPMRSRLPRRRDFSGEFGVSGGMIME